jgi:hypothetical protein
MSLAEQFRTTVTEAFRTGGATADLLPLVFVRAAVSVLPVAGAGLSMTDHLRIPLAASDYDVVAAERLQTTIGEGPCLAAVRPTATQTFIRSSPTRDSSQGTHSGWT